MKILLDAALSPLDMMEKKVSKRKKTHDGDARAFVAMPFDIKKASFHDIHKTKTTLTDSKGCPYVASWVFFVLYPDLTLFCVAPVILFLMLRHSFIFSILLSWLFCVRGISRATTNLSFVRWFLPPPKAASVRGISPLDSILAEIQ